jgi:hypothetical protein
LAQSRSAPSANWILKKMNDSNHTLHDVATKFSEPRIEQQTVEKIPLVSQ